MGNRSGCCDRRSSKEWSGWDEHEPSAPDWEPEEEDETEEEPQVYATYAEYRPPRRCLSGTEGWKQLYGTQKRVRFRRRLVALYLNYLKTLSTLRWNAKSSPAPAGSSSSSSSSGGTVVTAGPVDIGKGSCRRRVKRLLRNKKIRESVVDLIVVIIKVIFRIPGKREIVKAAAGAVVSRIFYITYQREGVGGLVQYIPGLASNNSTY